MEKKNAIILAIGSFFAGAITGGASVYFFMKEQHKKDIENIVENQVNNIISNYQQIGNKETEEVPQQNRLPEIIKQDQERFEKEFNIKREEEVTPFKGKPKERHRRVESLFANYKPPTPEEKGEPQSFHPEDEEDKEKYYGPNFPREQDINEGIDEKLDYMEDDDQDEDNDNQFEPQYDDDLDSDLKERDENGITLPYTLTKEEFEDCYNNNTMYEKETLYWYEGNGILVQNDRHIEGNTPQDELIMEDDDKIIETIGDSAERFGENEDEPDKVYVKNEELCMLYEVIKIEDEYVFPKA